jgi:HAD superfamily phosphoserine phosphatase-like hydrolase
LVGRRRAGERILNVYDFDCTIYDGDCTRDFYAYCLSNRWSLARFWPAQAWAFLLYALGLIDKTRCKERFFVFFRGLPDMDNFVYDFWRRRIGRIKHFYQVWQKPDDLIISASPDFLVRQACRRLGIANLIASEVDYRTGKFVGANCYGEEKVRRFIANYPRGEVDGFFSDSLSDTPMARLAKRSYLVRKNQVVPWLAAPAAPAPVGDRPAGGADTGGGGSGGSAPRRGGGAGDVGSGGSGQQGADGRDQDTKHYYGNQAEDLVQPEAQRPGGPAA